MAAAPKFFTTKAQAAPHLGAGQTLGFTRGRGYYARTTPVRTPPVGGAGGGMGGGLQPLSGAQIANEIAGYTNQLPAPLTDQQIQQKAQSLISPIVQAITGQITAGEKAGAGAISGYANELAHNLAGLQPQIAGIYSQGEQAQAAANAAESGAIRQGGNQLAGQLSGEIAKLDGPAGLADATVTPMQQAASGGAAAMLGTGSSFLDKLIAEGTNANALAAKQPGFALSRGMQDINSLSLASQKQLADALSKEQEQVPGLVQNLEAQNLTAKTNRATAGEKAREYYTARNDALLAGSAKNAATVQAATTKANATAYAARVKAQSARESAQAKASETSFKNRLAFAKTYGYDPVTGQPLPGYAKNANGQIVKVSTSKSGAGGGGPKPLTASEVTHLVQQWHDGKSVSSSQRLPHADANGNPVFRNVKQTVGQVNYQQAYKLLRLYGQSDQQARAALNTVYGRGDQGRAWLTNDERQALGKAGRQTTVGFYQGHAFIGPKQVAVLSKAGMLPVGELVNGRYFIKPGA
jgi:hypothetical protein